MIHLDLAEDRHDPARTIEDITDLARQITGNEQEVARIGGKPVTVADIGQLLLAVTLVSASPQNDQFKGYRLAREHALFALGWALHALGIPQSLTGPRPGTGGPNRAQRRAAKKR